MNGQRCGCISKTLFSLPVERRWADLQQHRSVRIFGTWARRSQWTSFFFIRLRCLISFRQVLIFVNLWAPERQLLLCSSTYVYGAFLSLANWEASCHVSVFNRKLIILQGEHSRKKSLIVKRMDALSHFETYLGASRGHTKIPQKRSREMRAGDGPLSLQAPTQYAIGGAESSCHCVS